MFIKSLTLDGFKSYRSRVTITDFDPYYNVLTGYNGVGKSVVVEAIGFAMGLSQISKINASCPEDLIWKFEMQATVSIKFDNRNKTHSPHGYESLDEITVERSIDRRGIQKFTINRRAVKIATYKNLFRSVRLNVDNPHFIHMQGSLSRVLDKTPLEFLSLISASANIYSYESQEHEMRKLMKENKADLSRLQESMNTTEGPRMIHHMRERVQLIEFRRVKSLVEDIEKLQLAYRYSEIITRCKEADSQDSGRATLKQKILCMEKENPWLVDQKTEFGVAGGSFDFSAKALDLTPQRLAQLKAKLAVVRIAVNRHAITECEEYEPTYARKFNKITYAESLHSSYEQNLASITTVKIKALEDACANISDKFNLLVKRLIPGVVMGQIVAQDNMPLNEGIEVRVDFGGRMQEVCELSHSQRGMVALAFQFALVLHESSPLCVLDNVDCQFDPDAAETVRNVIQNVCSQTQFILVSMNGNIVKNANVLYNVRCSNEISSVERIDQRGHLKEKQKKQQEKKQDKRRKTEA